jgi:uncharacterized protein (DUF1501 family)
MTLSRRIFLRNGAIAVATLGGGAAIEPGFLGRACRAADASHSAGGSPARRKVLVCVFQRGAADGLSMVAPHGDPFYYKARQETAIPRPKPGDAGAALDLDGYFGLHPRLDPLLPLFKRGELAVVHACGSPSTSRSHFDMQDFMEAGVADDKSVATGWANRLLSASAKPAGRATPFRGVAMGGTVPRTLQGDADVLAIRDLSTFGVRGADAARADASGFAAARQGGAAEMRDATATGDAKAKGASPAGITGSGGAAGFEGLYEAADGGGGDALAGAGRGSFEAMAMLRKADPTKYAPAKGVTYPGTPLGQSMLQVAQLLKADLGVEVAFVEDDGWDTHANQGGPYGQMGGKLLDFGRALAAFNADLGDRMADVMVLTMTEFGRAVRQNGNRGTDHGHGTCFLALGGGVAGGKVYGDWPTLAPETLFEDRDLAVTTDFRDLFAEVCARHLGVAPAGLATVFPKHAVDPAKFRGFVKA